MIIEITYENIDPTIADPFLYSPDNIITHEAAILKQIEDMKRITEIAARSIESAREFLIKAGIVEK